MFELGFRLTFWKLVQRIKLTSLDNCYRRWRKEIERKTLLE